MPTSDGSNKLFECFLMQSVRSFLHACMRKPSFSFWLQLFPNPSNRPTPVLASRPATQPLSNHQTPVPPQTYNPGFLSLTPNIQNSCCLSLSLTYPCPLPLPHTTSPPTVSLIHHPYLAITPSDFHALIPSPSYIPDYRHTPRPISLTRPH
jgi:hypothetical protein